MLCVYDYFLLPAERRSPRSSLPGDWLVRMIVYQREIFTYVVVPKNKSIDHLI